MYRINLALYNTYDKTRWHEAHKRAVARAAPVAEACEGNLILLDFPLEREEIEKKLEKTTINTSFLTSDKFHVLKCKNLPPQFGVMIATTSKPEKKKEISVGDIIEILKRKSITLVIGLGRKGLPKEIKERAKYHLDITEKRISLETCTAIGAIPFVIYHLRRYV